MGGRCAACLVPVLSSILICNLVTCESTIQRTDYKTGVVTVCRTINCTAGSYVKVCTKNGTGDECERCPSGTHLPDNTSSVLPTPCVTGTPIIPPSGPLSSLFTTRGPTVSSTPQKTGPGRGTVTMVTLTGKVTTPAGTSDSPTDTSDSPSDPGTNKDTAIYIAVGVGVGVLPLVVAVLALVVRCYKLKRKGRSRPENGAGMNEMELQERNPLRDTSNMASNENGTVEHNSTGMPQHHSGTETTYRMGTGEATQNGYINTPLLYEIPSEEIKYETEETEQKELVAEHNHQSYGGEKRILPSLFNLSEQMSNNAAGSTIGLPSASTLDPKSITKEDDSQGSLKLNRAPSLRLNSFDKSTEVQ